MPRSRNEFRAFTIPAFVVAAVAMSGCSYDCGTIRKTVANATIRNAAGVALATVQAEVAEFLHPSYRQVTVGVTGPAGSGGAPLRGHVTRARLVSETGALLAEIPTGTATLYTDAVVALPVGTHLSSDEYGRVRGALLSGRAKVVIDTDLPGLASFEAVLANAQDVPGVVQRCSPT